MTSQQSVNVLPELRSVLLNILRVKIAQLKLKLALNNDDNISHVHQDQFKQLKNDCSENYTVIIIAGLPSPQQ